MTLRKYLIAHIPIYVWLLYGCRHTVWVLPEDEEQTSLVKSCDAKGETRDAVHGNGCYGITAGAC